eukprot:CAMPEP_0174855192 /NCGR_PEP_ID=MMETSP1114-20130205/32687_1 /TAXON_ID=312471 /ORGANISM="Neobodo designis, Strain CCAP 1951/1" /LENGTH=117 /DNA_ID=CAMNT_0016089923 /DNA_START=32 /DNA_END=385 /DNA_ORIENTATION=+
MALSKTDPQLKSLGRREKVMRLELERRALRESARATEAALEALSAHLARIDVAKKDWLRERAQDEAERRTLGNEETAARRSIEDTAAAHFDRLYLSDFLPKLQAMASPAQVPRHRRR